MNAAAKISRIIFPAVFAAAAIFMAGNSLAQAPRAVSIDYCADQYLLALAGPEQIIAVSKSATDQHSFYRERAVNVDKFNGTAEEILTMKPELVIATNGAYNVLSVLNYYEIKSVVPKSGNDPDTVYENLRLYAKALNRQAIAENMIDDYKKRVADLKKNHPRDITVAYLTPSGFTAGTGTFVDDIIKLAGLDSFAEKNKLQGWQSLSLELMIKNPPDMIISSFFDQDDVHVSHWSLTRHPRIMELMVNIPTVAVPGDLLSCSGLFSIEAAEYIRSSTDQIFKIKGQKE